MAVFSGNFDDRTQEVIGRIMELRGLNEPQWSTRDKIRKILNGGVEGISALVGKDISPNDPDLPAVNLMLNASQRLGQKLGRRPDVKVDPPISNDSERARKSAEKRARIVESYDSLARLELQLPQVGRWLPGYGFAPFIIEQRRDLDGQPYPHVSLRDPLNAFPDAWTHDQTPRDIAFIYQIPVATLAQMYPEHADAILKPKNNYGADTAPVMSRGGAHWGNQFQEGLDVYEYFDTYGCWWVLPARSLILSYVPNPLASGPAFVVAKRFAFDRLVGQYDQIVGLQANIARLNVLVTMAAEDSVFAETNVAGDIDRKSVV